MTEPLVGIYERLLDEELKQLLDSKPELQAVIKKIDDEAAPHTYSQFIASLTYSALRQLAPEDRLSVSNKLIELMSQQQGLDYLSSRRLLDVKENLLLEVKQNHQSFSRPITPLNCASLLTGQGGDPPLEHEIRAEMDSADRVDILVSFIKWSGLRLLQPAFEKLRVRNVKVRIISTSYMGASDPAAVEWLASQPNIDVRISYDTAGTRLHAKAYHFWRKNGFSTAYIGSANLSHAAMTNGLEWTIKVTAQDMPHILDRFEAEFSTYWESRDFEPFSQKDFKRFRQAIRHYREVGDSNTGPHFFAEILPRPFQQRILEQIQAARKAGFNRNLVVAATGTGKTVMAALDYRDQVITLGEKPKLLFVAHRKEILKQARDCFRSVLRDGNFGELLVDGEVPNTWNHVFASVQSLNNAEPWNKLGAEHFSHIIVDEAHHGVAGSYRGVFELLKPKLLLGLTATPERMDRSSILPDFDNRITAEIRLPEALNEKLLCPFHYFGVTDNTVDLSGDQFWRNGRYNDSELEKVLTGDDIRAKQRVDLVLDALHRYQPDLSEVRGVGFCAGVAHAKYMADHFKIAGIPAEVVVGETLAADRDKRLQDLRDGKLKFVFTVDVLSEGVDIPHINMVMFLRPTESLTVFLQQLGRGLRHAPGKDCLTVLDFVGQTHRNYRVDTRFSALLLRNRRRLDQEVEDDFPSLPAGCNIQLERVARERVLNKIREVLKNLQTFVPEAIRTWKSETNKPLTFGNFIDETGLSAAMLLRNKTWSEWKALARGESPPKDPNIELLRDCLPRLALRNDPDTLKAFIGSDEADTNVERQIGVHYLRWGVPGKKLGLRNVAESAARWHLNPSVVSDAEEIATWRMAKPELLVRPITLPFPCELKLHGTYSAREVNSAFGKATLDTPGPVGTGMVHVPAIKCYVHLVTFNKDDRLFSPTTRYRDYPISATLLHWESQSTTSQQSTTGQNYLNFQQRGYTILFFARLDKRIDGETAPFIFLGPAKRLVSAEGDRPIRMVWELEYAMPAALLEFAKPVA